MKPKDLRDEFAMAAMPPLVELASESGRTFETQGVKIAPSEYVAICAYKIADAMMAEREKTNDAA